MKKLGELYDNLGSIGDINITGIKMNSKDVESGDLFVCVNGYSNDRHEYAGEAVDNGAVAVVASRKIEDIEKRVPVIYVEDTNKELSIVSSKFYNHPEDKMELIAITGTNGKTTTAQLIQDLMGNSICGYLGTNGIICSKFNEKIVNTTPDADRLFKYFDKFVSNGCKYLSLEASSEGLARGRLYGLKFKVAILTNITQDHLNFHKTIENYIDSKHILFKQVSDDGFSILNIDDKYFEQTKSIANGKILTYGRKESDLQIIDYKLDFNKTTITLKYKDSLYTFDSPLIGEFNIYNLCAGMLALLALNYDINDIINNVKNINVPHGRVEFLNFGQDYNILLDYAHTPDAFRNLYKLLNGVKTNRIITVTGSAGGREHEKRPDMGRIVLDNSDYVIFTMDDPREEDVNTIIDDLVSSTDKTNYERIIDREEAIYKAFDIAKPGDIVLIAGKGTDNYMALGKEYVPYCDLDVIKKYFEEKM